MVKNSKLITAKQAKDIDIKVRKLFGISTLVLMENAGRQVADEAIKILKKKKTSKVAVFCGKGNNGADGFVAARHLLTRGIKPDIFLAGKINDVKNEARINLEILLKLKQKIIEAEEGNLHFIKNKISKYALVIDALLGVGLEGEARGMFRDLIGIINSSKAYILSVDIPSGLDATTGKVLGCCVKADKTVTFVAKKSGMVFGEGPKYCGRVIVKDLGIPL
jgi:NAD(P)H-hydrate epimerase